jgi:hypothetical protein
LLMSRSLSLMWLRLDNPKLSGSVGVMTNGDGLPERLLAWAKFRGLDLREPREPGLKGTLDVSLVLRLLLRPERDTAISVLGDEFFLLMSGITGSPGCARCARSAGPLNQPHLKISKSWVVVWWNLI